MARISGFSTTVDDDIKANPTVFGKILRGEIPSEIVYEDELCIAFKDVSPVAPVHVLVIPRRRIEKLSDVTDEDTGLLGHLMLIATKVAKQQNLAKGYRLVINNGEQGCQSVFHIHVHVIGGRQLTWPPG